MKHTKTTILNELHRIASHLEDKGLESLADKIDLVFTKVAADENLFEEKPTIEAEMTLEDAINNYDSNIYKVDVKGNWDKSEWLTIPDFFGHLSEEDLKAPASVDGNHIVVSLPNVGTQVLNMVPKQHWEDEEDDNPKAPEEKSKKEVVDDFHKRMMEMTGQNDEVTKEADVVEFKDDAEEAPEDSKDFRKSLEEVINQYSKENGSDTPDFILAEYLDKCIEAFDAATKSRSEWHGGKDKADNDFIATAAALADENRLFGLADMLDQRLS